MSVREEPAKEKQWRSDRRTRSVDKGQSNLFDKGLMTAGHPATVYDIFPTINCQIICTSTTTDKAPTTLILGKF